MSANIIEIRRSSTLKILALDLGKKRIGLAISDDLGITAQGLETLQRKNHRSDLTALARIAGERGATEILVGNPLHMSGDAGRQSEWVRAFAEALGEKTRVPV